MKNEIGHRVRAGMLLCITAAVAIGAAVPVLAATAQPVTDQDRAAPASLTALLDRAQIEDMLVRYYGDLGGHGRGFGSYYTEDGVLDVNGIVAHGRQGIEALYRRIAQGSPPPKGAFRMLLTNPLVVVRGDTATADVIWTGVDSETVESRPHFVEQGREHDELVKRDGRWYIKYRVITSDGGLTPMFEKTYRKR